MGTCSSQVPRDAPSPASPEGDRSPGSAAAPAATPPERGQSPGSAAAPAATPPERDQSPLAAAAPAAKAPRGGSPLSAPATPHPPAPEQPRTPHGAAAPAAPPPPPERDGRDRRQQQQGEPRRPHPFGNLKEISYYGQNCRLLRVTVERSVLDKLPVVYRNKLEMYRNRRRSQFSGLAQAAANAAPTDGELPAEEAAAADAVIPEAATVPSQLSLVSQRGAPPRWISVYSRGHDFPENTDHRWYVVLQKCSDEYCEEHEERPAHSQDHHEFLSVRLQWGRPKRLAQGEQDQNLPPQVCAQFKIRVTPGNVTHSFVAHYNKPGSARGKDMFVSLDAFRDLGPAGAITIDILLKVHITTDGRGSHVMMPLPTPVEWQPDFLKPEPPEIYHDWVHEPVPSCCDIELQFVNGDRVPAHQCILLARSPTWFSTLRQYATPGKLPPDSPPREAMILFLEYIYREKPTYKYWGEGLPFCDRVKILIGFCRIANQAGFVTEAEKCRQIVRGLINPAAPEGAPPSPPHPPSVQEMLTLMKECYTKRSLEVPKERPFNCIFMEWINTAENWKDKELNACKEDNPKELMTYWNEKRNTDEENPLLEDCPLNRDHGDQSQGTLSEHLAQLALDACRGQPDGDAVQCSDITVLLPCWEENAAAEDGAGVGSVQRHVQLPLHKVVLWNRAPVSKTWQLRQSMPYDLIQDQSTLDEWRFSAKVWRFFFIALYGGSIETAKNVVQNPQSSAAYVLNHSERLQLVALIFKLKDEKVLDFSDSLQRDPAVHGEQPTYTPSGVVLLEECKAMETMDNYLPLFKLYTMHNVRQRLDTCRRCLAANFPNIVDSLAGSAPHSSVWDRRELSELRELPGQALWELFASFADVVRNARSVPA